MLMEFKVRRLDSVHVLPLTEKLDLGQARCFIFLHNSCFSILLTPKQLSNLSGPVSFSLRLQVPHRTIVDIIWENACRALSIVPGI